MNDKAFQDYYPDHFSHCYGCGRLNEQGLKIKSYWDGDETVCTFSPEEKYTAIPGLVYGGLIASIIDCHSTGSAAAFAYRSEGREMGSEPAIRFLTASLHVDYLRPTPLGVPLTLRSHAREIIEESDRKRAKFVRDMIGVNWTDARNFHLCLDASLVGLPASVDLIRTLVREKTSPKRSESS